MCRQERRVKLSWVTLLSRSLRRRLWRLPKTLLRQPKRFDGTMWTPIWACICHLSFFEHIGRWLGGWVVTQDNGRCCSAALRL